MFFLSERCTAKFASSALLFAILAMVAMPLATGSVDNAQTKSGGHRSGWDSPSDYPVLRTGVWERTTKRILPSGKAEKWISKGEFCHDTRLLFWSYLGRAEVELGGCIFHSEKISDNKFRIDSRCSIEKHQIATSESHVTIHGDSVYDLEVEVKEGRRLYKIITTARRTGDCPNLKNTGD